MVYCVSCGVAGGHPQVVARLPGRQRSPVVASGRQVARSPGRQLVTSGRQWSPVVARSPVYHKPKRRNSIFAGNGFPKCGESPHRAPAPICEAIKCSVMSRVGCRASGEHWRAWFWAVSKALCSSLEGAWTSISTVPQVSFMVECASSIEAIERRRPMSGAAELLASSGGLDFKRFQKRPAALQKEPASASQQCLKPPSWSSVHPRSKPSNGGVMVGAVLS